MAQPLSIDGPPDPSSLASTEEQSPFEKYDPLLHAGIGHDSTRNTRSTSKSKGKKEVLSITFVKKYIQYAKARQLPQLTIGAAEHITYVYTALRNNDAEAGIKKVCPSALWVVSAVVVDSI